MKPVQHSPKIYRKGKRQGEWGESPFLTLSFGQNFSFFFQRSVITGLVPGFSSGAELVHVNLVVFRNHWTDWVAFTGELTPDRIGS